MNLASSYMSEVLWSNQAPSFSGTPLSWLRNLLHLPPSISLCAFFQSLTQYKINLKSRTIIMRFKTSAWCSWLSRSAVISNCVRKVPLFDPGSGEESHLFFCSEARTFSTKVDSNSTFLSHKILMHNCICNSRRILFLSLRSLRPLGICCSNMGLGKEQLPSNYCFSHRALGILLMPATHNRCIFCLDTSKCQIAGVTSLLVILKLDSSMHLCLLQLF
jgi:hypothetical protein